MLEVAGIAVAGASLFGSPAFEKNWERYYVEFSINRSEFVIIELNLSEYFPSPYDPSYHRCR